MSRVEKGKCSVYDLVGVGNWWRREKDLSFDRCKTQNLTSSVFFFFLGFIYLLILFLIRRKKKGGWMVRHRA